MKLSRGTVQATFGFRDKMFSLLKVTPDEKYMTNSALRLLERDKENCVSSADSNLIGSCN